MRQQAGAVHTGTPPAPRGRACSSPRPGPALRGLRLQAGTQLSVFHGTAKGTLTCQALWNLRSKSSGFHPRRRVRAWLRDFSEMGSWLLLQLELERRDRD